jgi:hypothetical protein
VGDVEGAMQTPDGRWRVAIVRRNGNRWYRIVAGEQVLDWLSIAAVERILDEAGVDRDTLVEVRCPGRPPIGRPGLRSGRTHRSSRRPPVTAQIGTTAADR